MKKEILVAFIMLCGLATITQAQEGDLHGAINATFDSKYIWRGFDNYADKSAIHAGVDLDLYGSGFGVSLLGHRANSSEFEDGERWDYTLYYGGQVLEDQACATNYRLAWVYYNYPDNSRKDYDLQEAHLMLSWPDMCQSGLVPGYILVKMWPARSGSKVGSRSPFGGTASGFAHIFTLDYPWTVEGLLPEIPEQVLNLHAELIYNDGVGPGGQNVDHDWSNAVLGVSTVFDLGENVTLTPGIYHQITMDKSVNDDQDETWASVNLKYTF
ncbi:MAG: hypothetical protein JXB29_09925 [Sedimentisphaerales bacterium]|nr:hypothetical protein [Sedimentisphaerales bacterium]